MSPPTEASRAQRIRIGSALALSLLAGIAFLQWAPGPASTEGIPLCRKCGQPVEPHQMRHIPEPME